MSDDFLSIMNDLTNFVQNERTSSYNEGVDMVLHNARAWMNDRAILYPQGEHIGIPDLLIAIDDHYTALGCKK